MAAELVTAVPETLRLERELRRARARTELLERQLHERELRLRRLAEQHPTVMANQALAEANGRLRRFASVMSHDLRSPVLGAKAVLALLRDDERLPDDLAESGDWAREKVRTRLGLLSGESPENIFLFSSGMAAIAAVHRAALRRRPEAPTVQVEFPYVDALKVQQHFAPGGVIDLSIATRGGAAEVGEILSGGKQLAAVFSEAPSNPLLRTADLAGLRNLLEPAGVPLVVDDTVATAANLDLLRVADATTTSLTKLFSGAGDVMAGAVTVRHDSPFRDELVEALADAEADSPIFALDAIMLEQNSRDFPERVPLVNENGLAVAEFLADHPRIDRTWYPRTETPEHYEALLKPGGGYGGLMSFVLKDGSQAAPRFYDALEISKGPSLGTNFSLICPYTLLAHYSELAWAAQCGVEPHLLRLWCGLEETDDLLDRLERALDA